MAVADMAIMEEGRASITEADSTSTGMDDASGNESIGDWIDHQSIIDPDQCTAAVLVLLVSRLTVGA
jgi:hypothetical protein